MEDVCLKYKSNLSSADLGEPLKASVSWPGFILALILLFISSPAFNQQTPVFSAYFFNRFLVNPAFTGIDNQYRAFGFYRTQWGNMPMRPVTAGATAEGSFWKDRIGIGLQGTNDQAGIFNQTTIGLSYAQKIRLGKEHQLYIGIEGKMIMSKINFSAANPHDAGDPGIADLQPNRNVFDFGLGIAYSFKSDLLIGFSVPNILQPNAKYASTGQQQASFQYLRNYTAFVQYRIRLLHEKFNITPTILMRKAETSGFQFDGTLMFDYKNIVFVGGGYRNSFGVMVMAGVNILSTVTLAYAYDYTAQPVLSGQVGSTHEITLGFHLPSDFKTKKKNKELINPAGDEVIIKQSVLDSLNRTSDSLNSQMAEMQNAIDSLAKVAKLKAQQQTIDSMNKQLLMNDPSASNIAGKSKEKAVQDKPYATARAVSDKIDLEADKNAGQAFKLDKISFEYKQYRLLPQSREQLDTLVNLLKKFPQTHILIKGYTDNIGSDEYNTRLSTKRAEAVVSYLVDHGINKARLRSVGLGSQNPAADNDTEEGKNLNRRVEFTVER